MDKTWTFLSTADGLPITVYGWSVSSPKAIVVVLHGADEHARRYDRFAQALTAESFTVWAPDHRGHGASRGPEGLGDFGQGGWDGLVADIGQLIAQARGEHPDVPIVLFGISMGALAARQFAPLGSNRIDALILSATGAQKPPKASEPRTWPNFNEAFEPGRTSWDFLSRDEAEVDKFIADPLCGFAANLGVMMQASRIKFSVLADPEQFRKIRSDLPVLSVAGDADPVNRKLEGLHTLESWWRTAGVRQINKLYYEGGRHCMLHEANRDEVTRDIIGWIHKTLGG